MDFSSDIIEVLARWNSGVVLGFNKKNPKGALFVFLEIK